MADKGSASYAAVMAQAVATLAHAQVMRQGLAEVMDDGPGLDGLDNDPETGGRDWRDGEESDDDDPSQVKRTRLSYSRPDYATSAWGVMLEKMEALHAKGLLNPTCKEAVEFKGRFRVAYEFFLWLIDIVRP